MDADFKFQYYDASVGFIYEYNVQQYYHALYYSFYSVLDFIFVCLIFIGFIYLGLGIIIFVKEKLL